MPINTPLGFTTASTTSTSVTTAMTPRLRLKRHQFLCSKGVLFCEHLMPEMCMFVTGFVVGKASELSGVRRGLVLGLCGLNEIMTTELLSSVQSLQRREESQNSFSLNLKLSLLLVPVCS